MSYAYNKVRNMINQNKWKKGLNDVSSFQDNI